jgi:CRISPR-associated protein Cas2
MHQMKRPAAAVTKRGLYIAAYDIACPTRLRRALTLLKAYASGRQKSVFEIYLNEPERAQLLDEVAAVIDADEDRFFLLRLSRRRPILQFGIAVPPLNGDYLYID